jgi:acyl-CoA synthetase (AMP-forming)/AMP-acid ligase II
MELIERERGTTVLGWPTFVQVIRAHPDYPKRDLSSAPILVEGPADVSMRGVPGQTPTHRGMSETAGSFFSTGIRIVDPTTGEPVPRGAEGELLVRGPGAMAGYYKKEAWEVFDDDGWFHTGDIGALTAEGRVRYLGRTKDMLKVGGENVAAIEIESYLSTHPAVSIVAVVGVPDPKYMEVPAAFIELRPGREATEEELIEFCRGGLARFKVPRHVRFVDEWPMSATKIQKFRLQERLAAELAAARAG